MYIFSASSNRCQRTDILRVRLFFPLAENESVTVSTALHSIGILIRMPVHEISTAYPSIHIACVRLQRTLILLCTGKRDSLLRLFGYLISPSSYSSMLCSVLIIADSCPSKIISEKAAAYQVQNRYFDVVLTESPSNTDIQTGKDRSNSAMTFLYIRTYVDIESPRNPAAT